MEREAAVDRILAGSRTVPATTPPDWTAEALLHPPRKQLSEEEKKALRDTETQRGLALRGWWLQEMATTPSPVTEKLTLFWHGHFVSGQSKVKSAQLMYRQNALLRREALGNFATLLHDIARDPAMLRYLDTAGSRKGEANENFAREVMELFTLGEGHYSEQDIREAARAFTGWQLDPASGEPVFRPRRHDDGSKTVLGRSGTLAVRPTAPTRTSTTTAAKSNIASHSSMTYKVFDIASSPLLIGCAAPLWGRAAGGGAASGAYLPWITALTCLRRSL